MVNRIEKLTVEQQRELSDLIVEMSQSSHATDASWKAEIIARLMKRGFQVRTQCTVAQRGDGRAGRIAILASKPSLNLAVEFGHQSVRQRSAVKLSQVDSRAIRLVGLRLGTFNGPTLGIDHVFSRCAPGA